VSESITRDEWYRSIQGLRDEDLVDGMTGEQLEQELMRMTMEAIADEFVYNDEIWRILALIAAEGRLEWQRRIARRQRSRRLAQRLGH
jgi:hypothetical protein